MSNSVQRKVVAPFSGGRFIALALLWVAVFSTVACLAGWAFDVKWLREFGIGRSPMWPLTAVAFLCLATGYLISLRRYRRTALILWCVTILIAANSVYQDLSRRDLGTDTILFGSIIRDYAMPDAGRPSSIPVFICLLLSIAGIAAWSRGSFLRAGSGLAANAAFGLAFISAVVILFAAVAEASAGSALSLPTAIASVTITLGALILHTNTRSLRLSTARRQDWTTLRILLPLVLLLPFLPALFEQLLAEADLFTPLMRELIALISNMILMTAVVFWAVERIGRERSAAVELSEALESTTVVLVDLNGSIVHWSDGCEALYGWTAAEAQGQMKYALLHSYCPLHGLEGREAAEAYEMIERRRDGSEIRVLETLHRVDTPGRASVLVLNITDVTARVAAMAALETSEERLALATSAHELGVFEWDVPSSRLEWSPGTEQRLGLVPGTLNDFESWRAQVEPEDVQRILDTIARAVQNRASKFSYRYRFLQSNGALRAVEGSARCFYDTDGSLARTVGVILDVTEREEREAALRRREAQLRSVLETVPDAMIVIDESGVILQFSAAAEGLWGYRASDVVGQHSTMLAPPDTREAHMATLQHYMRTGGGVVGEVYTAAAETADGRRVPVEIRTGVAHVDGRALLTMFVRDISEQIENEARVSELSSEIAHVSRQSAMSELAADLAHELNQPLAATSNFLAAARMLLEKGESADRVTELLRMGSEQTQRAGEIIRRLRAFMARGEVEMRAESIDSTVREAAELVMVGTAQFQVRMLYHLDPEVPFIFADRIQIQQVLVNLMRNAMEALRGSDLRDRQITISSSKADQQMVEIAVTDNGPGIPAHVLEQLFSRFTTTKASGGGMGIGLSISRRIIDAHGGTLRAENRPEGGASFRFTLPAVEQGGE